MSGFYGNNSVCACHVYDYAHKTWGIMLKVLCGRLCGRQLFMHFVNCMHADTHTHTTECDQHHLQRVFTAHISACTLTAHFGGLM